MFAFLWACQALVHHEFYQRWLSQGDPAGWLVLVAALALLLRPGSLACLAALALTSTVYNVRKWPFVVNHVLVETLLDVTLLLALAGVALRRRPASDAEGGARPRSLGDAVYAAAAPVLRRMLVVVYAFAFLAKLNPDFLDVEVSCVSSMYDDLLERVPFLPAGDARHAAIWSTLAIEAALPLLLAFRRTRRWGVALGSAFHLLLGAIGHRTFSALAFALYALFVMDELVALAERVRARLVRAFGATQARNLRRAAGATVVLGVGTLVTLAALGHYRADLGPLHVYQIAWIVWGAWSLALMAAYALVLRSAPAAPVRERAPAWSHALVALVVLNGLAPYLGLKTETAFTMYSNLRTEAGLANHFFMPALRLADYQDDLVEVLASDAPALARLARPDERLPWFELRRIAGTTHTDFFVRYRRNGGEPREFRLADGRASDPVLAEPPPLLLRKLLWFRPVSTLPRAPCRH